MKWSPRSSVVTVLLFFLSHKAAFKLQSRRGVTARKEEENLIYFFFIFFFNLLFYDQCFAVSQSGGISLKRPLWQGSEEGWLGRGGTGSSLAVC